MELYNLLNKEKASSAGTIVDVLGETLSDRKGAKNIIVVMKDYGVDMSNNTRTQVNEEMVEDYDRLIVMAEPSTIPNWLRKSQKTEIWTVKDPKDQDIETTRTIVGEIKKRVELLK